MMTRSLGGGVNGAELFGVRDRVAAERAVRPRRVRAHPPQRRRVGMDGDRGRIAVLTHAMDVRGVEVERLALLVPQPVRGAAEDHALLDDLPLDDGDGARGHVVVVVARVVAVHPGDHPHVDVIVAPELLEVASRDPAPDESAPPRGVGGDARDELAQLAAVEIAVHAAAFTGARPSRRAGLRSRSAASTASPSPASAGGSTTGRSEPKTSWSTPISRSTMSTARAP